LKKFALISVSDKQDVEFLARELVNQNYSILATGNTAKVLTAAGIQVTEISNLTGFP